MRLYERMLALKNTERFNWQLKKRLPATVAAVLFFFVFVLYYLGVYDIAFIERPESWKNNLTELRAALSSGFFGGGRPDDDNKSDTERPAGDETSGQEETTVPEETKAPAKYDYPTEDMGATMYTVYPTVAELSEEGYSRSDLIYNSSGSFAFAKLSLEYGFPNSFSYSKKTYDAEKVTFYEDGTESTCETVRETGVRRAVELYMGYILYDDVGALYILGPDGAVLGRYDDNDYIPAYTRDTSGRPLFYRTYSYSVDYPTETGEEDEDGKKEWISSDTLKFEKKRFYYLNESGSFVESDYNDDVENRGLYFDYPSWYGSTDSDLSRYYKNITTVFTDLDGKTTVKATPKWLFRSSAPDYDDPETVFRYNWAYSFRENYAVVSTDIDWSYYHEKEEDGVTEEVSVTSKELRVVDKNGIYTFESRKNYVSDLGWTANERYVDPLQKGIESIGSYYFDHGLLRLRVQSYDRYYFTDLDSVKIVSDDDILVYPDGKKFNLPGGYSLKGYSDGMILLEKDGKYGYMNTSGAWVIQPELEEARPFVEGVAAMKKNGKWGMVDTQGKAVIPFIYDYVSDISSGNAAAYSPDSGWLVYQKMAK